MKHFFYVGRLICTRSQGIDLAQYFIQGITADGKPFRPSDWAERLCGVMSPFRPGGAMPGSHLSFSPYVLPSMVGEIRCVVVDERIKDLEPMAWTFLQSFATDNGLVMSEACLIPTPPQAKL
jgi:Protein of unknown function (DUF3579)